MWLLVFLPLYRHYWRQTSRRFDQEVNAPGLGAVSELRRSPTLNEPSRDLFWKSLGSEVFPNVRPLPTFILVLSRTTRAARDSGTFPRMTRRHKAAIFRTRETSCRPDGSATNHDMTPTNRNPIPRNRDRANDDGATTGGVIGTIVTDSETIGHETSDRETIGYERSDRETTGNERSDRETTGNEVSSTEIGVTIETGICARSGEGDILDDDAQEVE